MLRPSASFHFLMQLECCDQRIVIAQVAFRLGNLINDVPVVSVPLFSLHHNVPAPFYRPERRVAAVARVVDQVATVKICGGGAARAVGLLPCCQPGSRQTISVIARLIVGCDSSMVRCLLGSNCRPSPLLSDRRIGPMPRNFWSCP